MVISNLVPRAFILDDFQNGVVEEKAQGMEGMRLWLSLENEVYTQIRSHPLLWCRLVILPHRKGFYNANRSKMAQQDDGFIKFTPEFITKTLIGKVKCAQLVFTLLAGACGSSVYSYYNCNCSPKISFFDFVAWTAFINALIDMIIHLLGLWERLVWIFRHPAIHAVLCAIAVVSFLISASLAASCAKDWCVTSKGTAGAASFFGFVCLVLFGVEAFLQFQEYRGMQQEARHQSSAETKQPDYIEPPPSGVVWKSDNNCRNCSFFLNNLFTNFVKPWHMKLHKTGIDRIGVKGVKEATLCQHVLYN